MHLPEQAPIGGDAADRRKMIARQFDTQHWRLPARRPVAHGHRHEVKGRLIPLFRHFLVCTMVTLDYRLSPHVKTQVLTPSINGMSTITIFLTIDISYMNIEVNNMINLYK